MSFRLGEGAMIFDVLEDQSSLDDVGIFVFSYHPSGTSCLFFV